MSSEFILGHCDIGPRCFHIPSPAKNIISLTTNSQLKTETDKEYPLFLFYYGLTTGSPLAITMLFSFTDTDPRLQLFLNQARKMYAEGYLGTQWESYWINLKWRKEIAIGRENAAIHIFWLRLTEELLANSFQLSQKLWNSSFIWGPAKAYYEGVQSLPNFDVATERISQKANWALSHYYRNELARENRYELKTAACALLREEIPNE